MDLNLLLRYRYHDKEYLDGFRITSLFYTCGHVLKVSNGQPDERYPIDRCVKHMHAIELPQEKIIQLIADFVRMNNRFKPKPKQTRNKTQKGRQ